MHTCHNRWMSIIGTTLPTLVCISSMFVVSQLATMCGLSVTLITLRFERELSPSCIIVLLFCLIIEYVKKSIDTTLLPQ